MGTDTKLIEKRNTGETAIGVGLNISEPEQGNVSHGFEMIADDNILEKDLDEEMSTNANVCMEAEKFLESPSTKQRKLCDKSKQHPCQKCGKPVCNLFCSIPDPSSDNEMYRIHKSGDLGVSSRPLNVHSVVYCLLL